MLQEIIPYKLVLTDPYKTKDFYIGLYIGDSNDMLFDGLDDITDPVREGEFPNLCLIEDGEYCYIMLKWRVIPTRDRRVTYYADAFNQLDDKLKLHLKEFISLFEKYRPDVKLKESRIVVYQL